MPLYEYRCSSCGPFEVRRAVEAAAEGAATEGAATEGAGCPSCGVPARRILTAPGGRGPRRRRQLEGVSGSALRRVDRAGTGAPVLGALPAGVPLDRGGKPRTRPSGKDDRRPWQIGH